MKIAIVGSGVSGLVSAHLLSREHEITLFEAKDYVGGHTVTTRVGSNGDELDVDAGFIVFNEANYPNFTRLLAQLEVETQPSNMSFSVTCERTGLEYAGTSLDTLFAQRSNLLKPRFYRFARDIVRFNRAAKRSLANGLGGTLGEFLGSNRLSAALAEHYVIPLTAAIWSTDPRQVLSTPARFVLRFLDNHNLLGTSGFHTWRVIKGGSRRYVEKLIRPFVDRIRLRSPVHRIERGPDRVRLASTDGWEDFDQVVVAAHSDQALRMLAAPTRAEAETLGAIRYQDNRAILHTDASVLPSRKKAWASWNYRNPRQPGRPVAVTYNMNLLQSLPTDTTYCVTLNPKGEIDRAAALARFDFEHPLFDTPAVAAQARHAEISGADRVHYCGAYWRNGFHEDGVVSALAVCRRFGLEL